jgi:hypothetical protein
MRALDLGMLLPDGFIAASQWRAEYANLYVGIPFGSTMKA